MHQVTATTTSQMPELLVYLIYASYKFRDGLIRFQTNFSFVNFLIPQNLCHVVQSIVLPQFALLKFLFFKIILITFMPSTPEKLQTSYPVGSL